MSETASSALRQLQAAYDHLVSRAHPWPSHPVLGQRPVADHVVAVGAGEDGALQALVVLAQAGDEAAATVALWALLPALRQRAWGFPRPRQPRQALNDHLTCAYQAIRDADPGEERLAERIVERAHGRWRRGQARDERSEGASLEFVSSRPWRGPDPVSDDVVARLCLGEVASAAAAAIHAGTLSSEAWAMLLASRLGGAASDELGDAYGLSGSGVRTAVARATGRLRHHVA